jgi:hypothetical protein
MGLERSLVERLEPGLDGAPENAGPVTPNGRIDARSPTFQTLRSLISLKPSRLNCSP